MRIVDRLGEFWGRFQSSENGPNADSDSLRQLKGLWCPDRIAYINLNLIYTLSLKKPAQKIYRGDHSSLSKLNSLMRILSTFLLASLFLVTGCDVSGPEAENNELPKRVQKLKSRHADNLDHMEKYLRNKNSSPSKRKTREKKLESFFRSQFGEGSEEYRHALRAFNGYNAKSAADLKETNSRNGLTSDNVKRVVLDTRTAIRESKSFKSFKGYVRQKRKEILTSDWKKEEKVTALSYLVLLKQSLGFMKANQDLIPIAEIKSKSGPEPQEEEPDEGGDDEGGWWSSWGKCVAGTTGGAIMGGLTGAAAGSAVPAIGTGTGAAAGAVGGGLSGAAASC